MLGFLIFMDRMQRLIRETKKGTILGRNKSFPNGLACEGGKTMRKKRRERLFERNFPLIKHNILLNVDVSIKRNYNSKILS